MLYEGEASVPTPKPSELLIRVHAASINGIDLIVRAGTLKLLTGRTFPRRTGLDFAGEVAALGARASHGARASQFKVGDRVWGALPNGQTGSHAEFVSVLPERLSLCPSGLDDVEAAALPVVGATVITALRDIGQLKAGERLLVRGGSGGVGSIAVQLGRSIDAHVTALAGASNLEFVRALGADRVFDYATTRPAELGTFDVILDTVGSEPIHSYSQSLRYQLRETNVEVIEFVPPYVATELMGPRMAVDPNAMPLNDFIADVMTILEDGSADEICVQRVMMQRTSGDGTNPDYPALLKKRNDMLFERFAAAT